jgi:limonene-1,2-epoxide hydrolase
MSASTIVASFIRAIEQRRLDEAIALLSEDVSYENMPIQPIVGRDAVRATLDAFLAPTSEVDWQVLRQVELGDVVMNERVDRFRIGDGWLELPVAGVFEVVDGRIRLWRDYFDMGDYQRQLAELTGAAGG